MEEVVLRFIREGNLEEVQKIIANGFNVNYADIYGRTLLTAAVSYKRVNIVKWLIMVGVKVDLVGRWGNTALIEAVRHSYSGEIVKILIRAGANVHIVNCWGRDAIWYADAYYGQHNDSINIFRYLTHVDMTDNILALAPLKLSPYVLLWILQWTYPIPDGEQLWVLRLIEGIQRSCQKLKVKIRI